MTNRQPGKRIEFVLKRVDDKAHVGKGERRFEVVRGEKLRICTLATVWTLADVIAGHGMQAPVDILRCVHFDRLTFFRSAARGLHVPAARRAASRKTRRGSAGPANGRESAAAKS